MFDIGWTELLVLAIVAIIVVGPKDLPRMLRSLGKTLGQVRRTANDFKRQFDDALREAEREADLDDARKTMQSLKDPLSDVRKGVETDLDSVNRIGRDLKKPLGAQAADSESACGAATPQPAKPTAAASAGENAAGKPSDKAAAGKAAAQPKGAARRPHDASAKKAAAGPRPESGTGAASAEGRGAHKDTNAA